MAVASALFSCAQKQDSAASSTEASKDSLGGIMTTSDEKTKIVLSQIDAYEKGDTINFAPAIDENIRLYVPTDTAAAIKGRAEYVATMLVGQHQLYENIVHKNKRVSTVTMNNGEVWTLIWSIWTADGKFTKKHITLPIHLALQWKGDKVVRELHFYDTHASIEEAAAAKK